MCGIFGWSFGRKPRITPGQREVLASALAVANATRGRESWGYFARSGDKGVVHREVGNIAQVSGLGSLGAWGTFMAHTRQSTTGKVTRENCHPFQVGNLLLAHNGVIFNHEELNKRHERTCAVDSIHLAKHLASDLPFSDIEGYGAIEWIDIRKPLAVNLCRLSSGSLSVAGVKSRGRKVGVVWSSDRAHLVAALDAAHLDWYMYEDLTEGQVYQANRGRYYILTSHRTLALAPMSSLTGWRGRAAARSGLWGYGTDTWDEYVSRTTPGTPTSQSVKVSMRDSMLTVHTADGTGWYKVPGTTEWFKDPDGEWRAHVTSPAGAVVSVKRREGKDTDVYDEVKPGPATTPGTGKATTVEVGPSTGLTVVQGTLPATSGHTPVDRGLWADEHGRIHDAMEECDGCGGPLTDEGWCVQCDPKVARLAAGLGLHGLTDEEWNARGGE